MSEISESKIKIDFICLGGDGHPVASLPYEANHYNNRADVFQNIQVKCMGLFPRPISMSDVILCWAKEVSHMHDGAVVKMIQFRRESLPHVANRDLTDILEHTHDGQPLVMTVQPNIRVDTMEGPVVLDPRGELHLEVSHGTDTKTLRVCPYTMARSSEVWDAILFGSSAEAQPRPVVGQPWTVSFPNDNIPAMVILLRIIHGDLRNVPSELGLEDLFDVTILTNKYKMTAVLSPWANTWIAPSRASTLAMMDQHPCDSATIMEWTKKKLWIAWELGDTILFELTCKKIMKDWVNEEHGSLYIPGLSLALVPRSILADIESERLDVIEQMLDIFLPTLNHWSKNRRRLCTGTDASFSPQCDATIYASLMLGLRDIGIDCSSFRSDMIIADSVRSLSQKLLRIEAFTLNPPRQGYYEGFNHRLCNPIVQMRQDVREIMQDLEFPLQEEHCQHLMEQAEKSGLKWW